ncbi:helix-turn-helix transcriptional regulator [Aneurinibacillus sp. REN35]|uniref:helix-turn-helix transcriptional regulator n=1 Tax=Aneurinibacillus sp. REN35 TaxID=3237286 RepID=UPI003528A419
MSKAKMIFDLIMYVNTKRNFTAQDIADEFQVSVRTAHRYLLEVSELGVPLYTEQGRHGGYRTLKNRLLPPILFDEDEAFAIFFAFQSLKYYQSLPFELNIDSASRKLFASFPDDTKAAISRLESILAFWNPRRSAPSPYLKEIITAVIEQRDILINYRSKRETAARRLKPIGIYAHDGLWYMPAYDCKQEKVQLFRVDRIESFAQCETSTDFQMDLMEYLQSYKINEPLRLHVTLTREGIRRCQSVPWLEKDVMVTNQNHGLIDTTFDKSELEFVAQFFLQLGTDAKVMEPQEVVDLIRVKAHRLLEHYHSES